MGSLKSRLASLGKKETIIASLLIASLGLTVGFSMMQEPEYQTIDEKVSPIGEQINSTDQYRFSEYKGNMLFGPYLVDDKRYFYYEGEVVNQNLKSVNRPQVEGLHNFYMKTYTDPLFYSPAAEDQQMNLSGFKRFEQDKILSKHCGLDYEVIPQQYFNELGKNYESTNQFYRYASVQNAQDLIEQNRQTVNGYSGMVSQFLNLMQKNVSQNDCFQDDARESGIAKATLTPVQYRIDTGTFLNYSRMANQNAELALEQVSSREDLLNGSESLELSYKSNQDLRNYSYNFNLAYQTGEEAKEEFNRRMVSEYRSLQEDDEGGGPGLSGDFSTETSGQDYEESEESEEAGEEEEEEESEGSIESMNIPEEEALEIARSELNGSWSFQNANFSEGALRHLFEREGEITIVEVTPNGRIAEKIVQRESQTRDNININYTEALDIAKSSLKGDWVINQRGTATSGKYRFGFSDEALNAEVTVDGGDGRILLKEVEYISEAVLEGGGTESETESEQTGTEETESAEEARSVENTPQKYAMTARCLDGDTVPVYGWDTNIYPNIISGEKIIEKSGENSNLRDFFTVCRCPYVDVTRLSWYVVDDQFKEISSNSVGSDVSSQNVHRAEQIFVQNPGEKSLSQLSDAYDAEVKKSLDNGEYSSHLPEMWRRSTEQSSKLYKLKTAYDDFYNEKHMEVWGDYFPYEGVKEDSLGRERYNYFLITESQYPLKFMTYSDSVWRLDEKPSNFAGRIGTSDLGTPNNAIPE